MGHEVFKFVLGPCQNLAKGILGSTFRVYEKQTEIALKQRDQFFRYRGSAPPVDARESTEDTANNIYLVSEYRDALGSKIPQTAFEQIYVYPVADKKRVVNIEAPALGRMQTDKAYHNIMGMVSSYNVGAALAHVINMATILSEGAARAINNIDKMEQGRFELFDDAAFARKMQSLNVGVTVGNTAIAGQASSMQAVQSQLGSLAASKAQGTADILSGLGRLGSDISDRFSTNKSADNAQTANPGNPDGGSSVRQTSGQAGNLNFEQDTAEGVG